MKLKDWLRLNKRLFKEGDLQFLLRCIFSEEFPFAWESNTFLDRQRLKTLEEVKRQYLECIPLAYILGREEFFGYEFKVNHNCLIPRKETELIVEKAIEVVETTRARVVLDLGCGCGNIGISLKKVLGEKVTVFCSDISFSAVRMAKTNSLFHKVPVRFVNADLFGGFKTGYFDLIISNPPYVNPRDINRSLLHEPRIALQAGDDGFCFLDTIIRNAHQYLNHQGYLILEMGYNHKKRVQKAVCNLGVYEIVEWIRDYSGYWRGVVVKKPPRV